MAEYLVELYVSQGDHAVARHHVAVAEQAGADLAREGRAVRYLQSFFVPEDETCFLLYEADSVDLVTEAVGRAGLRLEHVSAATTSVAGAQESPDGTTKGTSMTSTTTSTTGTPDLSELRDKQQKVWSSGDYNKIAALTVPVSEHLVDHVGVSPTDRVLDVATGTGHVALAAARRSAESVGIDYVPELLEIARRRAEAEDLVVELAEADAEHLPYEDASFDVVMSAIGVMFAADHDAAARELVRVTRSGGRIGIASWTPEGFVGGMLRTVGAHVSPPPGAQPATRWGTEEVVAGLLGEGVSDVRSETAKVTQRFTDAGAFADLFLTYYGPTFAAASRLDDQGRAALRADLVALAESHDRGEGDGLVVDWEYRIVTATRR
ncbi:methyltransferase domain-containing protein [Nocardioides sp. GCM10028917]|uniref:methyltransferase domain-containing protein n=1 Tax=Nocardioides sp. GCM10028917 TaxID=3273408 RepID=UPI003612D8CA